MESESEEEEERQVQWMFFPDTVVDPDPGPKDRKTFFGHRTTLLSPPPPPPPPHPTPKGLDAPLVSLPHVRFQC